MHVHLQAIMEMQVRTQWDTILYPLEWQILSLTIPIIDKDVEHWEITSIARRL